MKVGGKWKYLLRAVDKHGRLIDFMLRDRRNTPAGYRFLGKALTAMRPWPPSPITADQLGSHLKAVSRLQREGKMASETKHRTLKYLNNIIEADRDALKRVLRPTRGFQTMKTAAAMIERFEVMRRICGSVEDVASPVSPRSKTKSGSSTSCSISTVSPPDPNHPLDQPCPTRLMQQSPSD